MLAPFLVLAPLAGLLPSRPVWLALAAAPFALTTIRRFQREPAGHGLNLILAQTAQVQAFFALLLCLGASL
jgi:1,4-dihydroxy-2-naphthoate octaprenyltransferase